MTRQAPNSAVAGKKTADRGRWFRLLSSVLVLLMVSVLAGCLQRGGDSSWRERLRSFRGPVGSDVVVFQVAVLEVPAGQRFINGELWAATDDHVLPPEVRRKLDEHGLRVGRVSGQPPDGLLDLITSERYNPKAREVGKRSGDPHAIAIGPPRDTFRFEPGLDGKAESATFEHAQCQLQATPMIGPEGKVRFQFVPQIQHADRKKTGHLLPTLALGLQGNRATETLSALAWEFPLNPNEYIIIGTRFDKPNSLGFRSLVTADGDGPTQRLVAIRRFGPTADAALPVGDALPARSTKSASTSPLAIP